MHQELRQTTNEEKFYLCSFSLDNWGARAMQRLLPSPLELTGKAAETLTAWRAAAADNRDACKSSRLQSLALGSMLQKCLVAAQDSENRVVELGF